MLCIQGVNAQESFDTPHAQSSTTSTADTSVLKSKRGYVILPEAGEYALGISATSTLEYLSSLIFNNNTGPTALFQHPNSPFDDARNLAGQGLNNQLLLKKFKTANLAYRVRLQVALNAKTETWYVKKDELAPDLNYPQYVTDQKTSKVSGILVAAGIEKRRGKHRIQGVYGAEAYLGVFSSSVAYSYGNPFSGNFPQPTIYNDSLYNATNSARVTKQSYGLGFTIGVRPYLGVEYFIAPKISLGGEFGYNLGISLIGSGLIKSERWNTSTEAVEEIKSEPTNRRQALSAYGLGVNNLGGSLNLLFHF